MFQVSLDLSFSLATVAVLCVDGSVSVHVVYPGETAAVESEAVFCHLFSRFPAELFNEPMLAYEFVRFCLHNVSVLQEKVAIYRHSFPNLLKVTFPLHKA